MLTPVEIRRRDKIACTRQAFADVTDMRGDADDLAGDDHAAERIAVLGEGEMDVNAFSETNPLRADRRNDRLGQH